MANARKTKAQLIDEPNTLRAEGAEEELENIFNLSADMICICTTDGDLLKVSPSCERILGYKQEELLEMGWAKLVHPDDVEETNKEVEKQLKGNPVAEFVNRYEHKDGSYRTLEWQATPAKDGIVWASACDITERKKAEKALAEYRDKLRALSSQSLLAEEHERGRIAGLLHDNVCQMLGLAAMKLRSLEASDLPPEAVESVSESCGMLQQAIETTRTLISDLRPSLLYDLGLETAVDKLVEHMVKWQEDIEPAFEDDGQSKPLADNVRTLLYQSVRELLMNIVKHAQASKVKVSIRKEGSNISIAVEDDGVGFDVSEVVEKAAETDHFGLFSIRERMKDMNGKMEIESGANRGTRITLLAPLSRGHSSVFD